MTISPEVKKYSIVGGALVLAVIGGIFVYRRYQNNAASATGAADQANQDTLAYEEEQLAAQSSGGYGSYAGSSFAPQTTFSSGSSPQTLAEEISSLENIFNPPAPAAPVSPVPAAGTPKAPVSPVTPPASSAPVLPIAPNERRIAEAEAPVFQHEGVMVA